MSQSGQEARGSGERMRGNGQARGAGLARGWRQEPAGSCAARSPLLGSFQIRRERRAEGSIGAQERLFVVLVRPERFGVAVRVGSGTLTRGRRKSTRKQDEPRR